MNIKDKAKEFAINAHKGQIRKSDKEKPMIIHPINVADILSEYGFDDNVVAAGYLHDVIEDTKYTKEDLLKAFNEDILSLVLGDTEKDKSLSWEERKIETINIVKDLDLRHKSIVCADKISNLEDMRIIFETRGEKDFSAFKRGYEKQKWYYTEVYNSLICNEDKDYPMFARLKLLIDDVFDNNKHDDLERKIFEGKEEEYSKLIKLHYKKQEIYKMMKVLNNKFTYVIEFTGTPRTGKTTLINNLYDFFKKGGFNTAIIEEFTTSGYYKEVFKQKYKDVSSTESNMAIIEEVTRQLEEALNSDKEIILIDRSVNDRQIWNYRRYIRGDMSEELYLESRGKYSAISRKLIDFLVITYAEPLISLKRDYNSSLALEKRNFLNIDNLNEYNRSLRDLQELFETSVEDSILLDTSSMSMDEVSVEIASQIMSAMRKGYIKSFKQKYNLR